MNPYAPHLNPGMYRQGRMTGAAYVRASNRLSWQQDGLFFQGAHRPGSPLASQLEAIEQAQRDLRAAYNESRAA